MALQSIRSWVVAFGTSAVLAAASHVIAAPLGGRAGDPIAALRKVKAAFQKADNTLTKANSDLTKANTAAQMAKASVDRLQGIVNGLIKGLPATAPSPETSQYVKKKMAIAEKEVELGNATSKYNDANAKVTDQKGKVKKCQSALVKAARALAAAVDAALESINNAGSPPLPPPCCSPLWPSSNGAPADMQSWCPPPCVPPGNMQ